MIPTRIHGVLDYVVGALLILAPFLFGFADGTAAQWVPTLLGIAAIVYSLITRYELSIAKILPMPTHLLLDAASGVLLAASPWLFGFADRIWWPHVVFGVLEIVVSALTQRHTSTSADRYA
jgi:hypothetical protein